MILSHKTLIAAVVFLIANAHLAKASCDPPPCPDGTYCNGSFGHEKECTVTLVPKPDGSFEINGISVSRSSLIKTLKDIEAKGFSAPQK